MRASDLPERFFSRVREGSSDFVYRIDRNGTRPQKVNPQSFPYFLSVSPNGEWLVFLNERGLWHTGSSNAEVLRLAFAMSVTSAGAMTVNFST